MTRPLVPDPEAVYEAFRAFALRTGHLGSLVNAVSLDDVKAFLDYIEGALRAIPVEPGESRGPFAVVTPEGRTWRQRGVLVNGPDDGLTETQGWLTAEVNYGSVFGMQWCDRSSIDDYYIAGDAAAVDDEVILGDVIVEVADARWVHQIFPNTRLVFSIRTAQGSDPLEPCVEEPAWILHRHVPKSKWDEMMSSQQWAYPVTKSGKLVTKRIREHRAPRGRDGRDVMELPGIWRYIGAPVPTNDPRDFTHWLDPYWRKALGMPRRTAEQRRDDAIAEQVQFKVGDRVAYQPTAEQLANDDVAIPANWRGRILSHEANIDDGLYFEVRWTEPNGATHDGLTHQENLVPAPITNPSRGRGGNRMRPTRSGSRR